MRFKLLLEKLSYADALKLFELGDTYTADDVNRKYKRLAIKYHPDHGGSVEKMQDINDARDTLLKNASYSSSTQHSTTSTRSKSNSDFDARKRSEEEWAKQRYEIEEIILDISKDYFKNFDIGKFKNYFDFVFKASFDAKVEYNRFFKDCHKNSGHNPTIYATFETLDRKKIIEVGIDINYYSLFDMIREGKSLSSDDMEVSYWTNLFIDGKKQKVAQRRYSKSNKKAILLDPEIIFPLNKMQKISSGEKRIGKKLKKADFESLIKLKHGGSLASNGYYRIPICVNAKSEDEIYMYISRTVILRQAGYRIIPTLQFWFPNGKPSNAEKVKKEFEKLMTDAKVLGLTLYETQSTLDYFDQIITKLKKSSFDDIVKSMKPFVEKYEEVHEKSLEELES